MTRLQTGQKIKFNDTKTPGWKDGTSRSETTRNDPKVKDDSARKYVEERNCD